METGKVHYFDIINEVRAVAEYMAAEMKNNAASWHAKHMALQNSSAQVPVLGSGNQTVAYLALIERVAPGRPWDHKDHFTSRQIGETVPGRWHTWGEWEYFHDVWSNIHYGYVGRASGFSERTLIDGANAQQQVHSWWTGKTSRGDPEQDSLAVSMGCRMYDSGTPVTPEALIQKVVQTPQFDRRPHSYESAATGQKTLRKR
uniref:Bacterial toxin 44 domain-containing protein n=1 Tax=Chondromyces crocatus TaxID=52 RepID=D7P609_CHOCO|nr:unknown [Chondromyces crocatus]